MSGRWRRTPRDPIYVTPEHRAAVRYWRKLRAPCHACGEPIDYEADGRTSRQALHVDHIVPVAIARARGWTDKQIAHLSNTRPLHRGCNVDAGAELGRRRARTKAPARPRRRLNTTRDW